MAQEHSPGEADSPAVRDSDSLGVGGQAQPRFVAPPRRVGVVLHPARDPRPVLSHLVPWAAGREIVLRGLDESRSYLAPFSECVDGASFPDGCDLVLAAGGDGTILRALHLATRAQVPVLGVNLGRLGFLAEVDIDELPAALSAVEAGTYTVESRAALDVRGPGLTCTEYGTTAFNDVAVSRRLGGGQVASAVAIDGDLFGRFYGDGVIVATATGSTAYSFAAGGPIISPRSRALAVTPLAPNGAFRSSLVVDAGEHVAVEILEGSGVTAVEIDGRPAGTLGPGDRVELRVGPRAGLLCRMAGRSFFARARRKLGLVDPVALGASPGKAP
jgi:NAD+ kinase